MQVRRFVKRSSILLAAVLIAFTLSEIIARFALGLGTPPLSVADSEIEYMFKPNQDVMRFGNHQFYNCYGMRSQNFSTNKPSNEIRILCFGDSVLNGGNLTDQSRLATTLLQKRLSEQAGRPVVVCNISAGSWGPPNMLAYAHRYGLFDADYVVVVISSHDITDVPTFDPLSPFTHPTKNPCCATWEGITRYLPRYVPVLMPILQPQPNSNPDPHASAGDEESYDAARKESLDSLTSLHEMARLENAGFLLVLHSEREEAANGIFKDGHAEFEEWARQNNVDELDMSVAESESLKTGGNPYRENDSIHISDAGQALLGDNLFRYFAKRIIVK